MLNESEVVETEDIGLGVTCAEESAIEKMILRIRRRDFCKDIIINKADN